MNFHLFRLALTDSRGQSWMRTENNFINDFSRDSQSTLFSLFLVTLSSCRMADVVLLSPTRTYSLISRRSLVEHEDCCFDSMCTAVAIDNHYLNRIEHEDRHRSSIRAAYQYIRSLYRWYRTRLERFLDFSRRYCEQWSARQNWSQLTERRQG